MSKKFLGGLVGLILSIAPYNVNDAYTSTSDNQYERAFREQVRQEAEIARESELLEPRVEVSYSGRRHEEVIQKFYDENLKRKEVITNKYEPEIIIKEFFYDKKKRLIRETHAIFLEKNKIHEEQIKYTYNNQGLSGVEEIMARDGKNFTHKQKTIEGRTEFYVDDFNEPFKVFDIGKPVYRSF